MSEGDENVLPGVDVTEDMVMIYDRHGEVVSWHLDEIKMDPTVGLTIAEALRQYYEHGPHVMRRTLGKPVGPYDALCWAAGVRDFYDRPDPNDLSDKAAIEAAFRGFFAEHPDVRVVSCDVGSDRDEPEINVDVKFEDGLSFYFADGSYSATNAQGEEVIDDNIGEDRGRLDACTEFADVLYGALSILRGVYGTKAELQMGRAQDGSVVGLG